MSLPNLADACRTSGLKVVELPKWQSRGRPGSFNPSGVLCHHTAGASDSKSYVEWMAYEGRSDLPAPLCQLALSRTGIVYVLAAGRANHGGVARATGPMPAGDANNLYVGIEAMNTGSEGWTDTQYDAYVRLCAALCRYYRWPASHVRAHKESSVTGKVDPGRMDMNDFRADVARVIDSPKEFTVDDAAAKRFDKLEKDVADLRKLVDERVRATSYKRDDALAEKVDAIAKAVGVK